MKKSYFFSFFILAGLGLSLQKSSFNSLALFHNKLEKNGGGSSPGSTGAPGEQNCTSCHGGAVLDGSNENVLVVLDGSSPVLQYVPGKTYTVSLVMSSNPSKKGFQATVLDASNAMAGTFTNGVNTTINGSAKKYANHNFTSNTSASPAWIWNWTAPATNVGAVKFYVATNKANGNNASGGDQIYLSQHTLTVSGSASIADHSTALSGLKLAYDVQNNRISLIFSTLQTGAISINLTDMEGRSVWKSDLGQATVGENNQQVVLPSTIKSGIYISHVFVNNHSVSRKLMIP